MTRTKQIAFHNKYERATLKSQRPKPEFETLGQVLKEFGLAILVVAGLYIILNLTLGWN